MSAVDDVGNDNSSSNNNGSSSNNNNDDDNNNSANNYNGDAATSAPSAAVADASSTTTNTACSSSPSAGSTSSDAGTAGATIDAAVETKQQITNGSPPIAKAGASSDGIGGDCIGGGAAASSDFAATNDDATRAARQQQIETMLVLSGGRGTGAGAGAGAGEMQRDQFFAQFPIYDRSVSYGAALPSLPRPLWDKVFPFGDADPSTATAAAASHHGTAALRQIGVLVVRQSKLPPHAFYAIAATALQSHAAPLNASTRTPQNDGDASVLGLAITAMEPPFDRPSIQPPPPDSKTAERVLVVAFRVVRCSKSACLFVSLLLSVCFVFRLLLAAAGSAPRRACRRDCFVFVCVFSVVHRPCLPARQLDVA